jgi:uncharacterized protein (DUF433 family)
MLEYNFGNVPPSVVVSALLEANQKWEEIIENYSDIDKRNVISAKILENNRKIDEITKIKPESFL